MTPAEFQTLALAWLGTGTVVVTAGIVAFFKIKALIDENSARIDKHDDLKGVDTKTADQPTPVIVLPPQPQPPTTP